MPEITFFNILITIFLIAAFLGLLYLINYILGRQIQKKQKQLSNDLACKKASREDKKRLRNDFFWADPKPFAFKMLLLTLGIFIFLLINHPITIVISIILAIVTFFFLRFAYKSYKAFPEKAAKELQEFEDQVKASIEQEISFKGDNIQVFSAEDEQFDTKPKIFDFPTKITKISFPPFETNPKKQPIIHTRKLEFLILSREYFSICKNASTFNLLEPARFPPMKQCAKIPGKAGECHEHYYSQMRNVEYDDAKECIRILYNDDRDDVEFPCKKMAPSRKPAMKALQEKLRLTERQRLHKIDEHEKFEEIQDRRSTKGRNIFDEEPKPFFANKDVEDNQEINDKE